MKVITHDGVGYKVPCGKCGFCLSNKRSSWMFRIYHEMRNQRYPGWFLTLTYDEKHVPRREGSLSLRFRDVQLFFKRLRKLKYYVKYVAVGEYGSETLRPHYHILLWTDCSCDVLQEQWKSSKDNSIFGSIHFGVLNMQSSMYALKYVIQPKFHVEQTERPRAQFSKGIGISYLGTDYKSGQAMAEYLQSSDMLTILDGQKVSVPRYYRLKVLTAHQRKILCHETKTRKNEEETRRTAELNARGVMDAQGYIQTIRSEQSRRIIAKTKVNQSL